MNEKKKAHAHIFRGWVKVGRKFSLGFYEVSCKLIHEKMIGVSLRKKEGPFDGLKLKVGLSKTCMIKYFYLFIGTMGS